MVLSLLPITQRCRSLLTCFSSSSSLLTAKASLAPHHWNSDRHLHCPFLKECTCFGIWYWIMCCVYMYIVNHSITGHCILIIRQVWLGAQSVFGSVFTKGGGGGKINSHNNQTFKEWGGQHSLLLMVGDNPVNAVNATQCEGLICHVVGQPLDNSNACASLLATCIVYRYVLQ